MKLTACQNATLAWIVREHRAGRRWCRARRSGERVTLASLYDRRILDRRVWRRGANSADNAHEYRLSDTTRELVDKLYPQKENA